MSSSPENSQDTTALKRALFALKDMRARLAALENKQVEPLAIIGLSCRFPGGANTPEAFWDLLQNGRDAITDLPPDRWDIDTFYDPNPDVPGKMISRQGGFVNPVDQFDPQLFGISPREAVSMDPQQRLLLETSWEALERAGLSPDKLANTQTGVYVGISTSDYAQITANADDLTRIDPYVGTGGAFSVAAGRLSYYLGLQGPNLAVDTACSSSLVALHLACQALRAGQADLALVGGVNLILTPKASVYMSKAQALSPDGRCKTFADTANGYGRGEGCGVVVLKRLSEALANNDNILAVVRGTAINHDGSSSGLTVPNGQAQQKVIRAALENAGGLAPESINYLEAHGTGTPLGDPIEVRAATAVLGQNRTPANPLYLGSVKTNIGHLEAAAGIAGLVKLVLAMQHNELPPHLHFHTPSPHIDWTNMPVKVVTQRQPWTGEDRLAGLSSFGFSGTNAHVIVGPAPQTEAPTAVQTRPMHLVTLSAQSEAALAAQRENLSAYLAQNPAVDLARLAHTLNNGRVHFPHRLAIPAATVKELAAALPVAQGQYSGSSAPKIAFLFTGQGAQLNGMGQQLYQTQPTFRAALDRCDELLRPFLQAPLLEVMFAEPGSETAALLHQTTYTQPALFAIEYALAQLWRAWGIQPTAVLGHSIGEISAACVAGVLSLEDAITLVAERGRLMGSLPEGGAMAAIFADETAVTAAIAHCRDEVAIAGLNGPANVVISGVETAVQRVAAQFEANGVKVRHLTVSHAFHSPLMDPILAQFAQVAGTLTYRRPRLRLISNLTGRQVQGDEAQTAVYWRDHIRQPVRFADGVAQLIADGFTHFVEIGPQPTLSGMALRLPGAEQIRCLPSLRDRHDDWSVLLRTLADLYQAGAAVNWEGFAADYGPIKPLPLPTYPFQRQRYWFESTANRIPTLAGERMEHPLLGQRLPIALPTYSANLSISQHGYLADHQIFGQIVLPATAYVELALAAAADHFGQQPNSLTDLSLQDAMLLSADSARPVQLVLQPEGTDTAAFQLYSQVEKDGRTHWQRHAQGMIQRAATPALAELEPLAALQNRLTLDPDLAAYYGQMADLGVSYGPAFRGVQQLWRGDGEALGRIQLPADVSCAGYHVHPALLDACLHVLGATTAQQSDATFLPVYISALHPLRPIGDRVFCYARLEAEPQADVLTAHLTLLDEQGALLLHIDSLRLQRVNPHMLQQTAVAPYQQWLYEVAWEAQPLTAVPPTKPQRWLLLADQGGVAQTVAGQLTAQGQSCTLLDQGDLPTVMAETLPLVDRVVDFWNLDLPMDGEPTAVQEQLLGHTLTLVQALAGVPKPPRLWLCSRGAQPVLPGEAVAVAQTTLVGLVRVIAQELPELACTQLDLDPGNGITALADELLHGSGEIQVAFRDGTRYVPRLARRVPAAVVTDGPVQLDIRERGVLDNLALRPADRPAPGPGEVEIEIAASGLNFRDVLNALGMYPEAAPLGGECAGRITAVGPNVTQFQIGDEVMALTPHAFSTYVITLADLVALKPRQMSFTDAAGIPIVFLTAEYALNHLGHMQKGSKVLIHAAAGGVGMAAIQLAQRAGAEVYATASPPKWDVLRQMGVEHLYNSRTLDFAEAIFADTNGAGVQIALNSLAGEFIPKTLGLVADGGHFVEIGRTGTWDDATVAADYPGVHNHVFFLGQLCLDQPQVVQTMLQAVLAGFADGSLRPLPTRVYDMAQVVEAFRFMAQARHVGKLVINHPRANVQPQPDATYLITGGLGSLGLRVARWLAEQGAGHLVLVSRREPSKSVRAVIAEIEGLGTAVHLFQADIAEQEAVDQIITTIDRKLPPLRGIIHAAGVLDDGLLLNQSWPRFERVLAPKVAGAWHLHQATLGRALDFFVLFSSTSALLGATGQSNYAAANAFLDGLAHYRRALGLPGLSINWGAWAEGGMAEAVNRGNNLAALGIRTIATQQGLAVLEQLLGECVPQVGVLPVDWHTFSRQLPPGIHPAFLARMLEQTAVSPSQSGASAAGPGALAARLAAARPDEQPILLREHVCNQARQVLGLSSSVEIGTKRPLLEMGLDSLMSVELRNALGQSLNQSLPASLLFDYPTIDALTDFLIELFWLKHLPPTNAEDAEEREEFEL